MVNNFTSGLYNISFFNMKIDTSEELTNEVIKKEESTFIHEFIHYLQDLILPYNIRVNLSNVRWLFNILGEAYKKRTIKRPFEDWNNESSILWTQFNNTFGHGNFIDKVAYINNITSDYDNIEGYDSNLNVVRRHRVYKYTLDVVEDAELQHSETYYLGARDLLEYIAYKIESKFFPDRPAAPQLPYESVDLIFDSYGLADISDEIKICIAERCLYNDAPVHCLLYVLLSDNKFKDFIRNSSYKDIYAFLLNSSTLTRDGYSEELNAKTQRRIHQFKNELQIRYGSFEEISKWLSMVSEFVKNNLSGKFIFSDIYKMNSDDMHKFVNDVINQVGIPLIMNEQEKYISMCPEHIQKSGFIQFYVSQKFMDFLFNNKETKCPIYGFCKANGGSCNENCVLNNNGIIMGNESCHYRKFIETYRLTGIKID